MATGETDRAAGSAPAERSERKRADAICIARNATCKPPQRGSTFAVVAIQFARARYISRSSGGSAVRSAAYNERAAITPERTGEVFYFKHRDAPEHHDVLLPEGAAEQFADSAVLWNAAEAAEKRKDAQVAREIVLALPAERGDHHARTGSTWRDRSPSSTSSPRASRCSSTCTRRMRARASPSGRTGTRIC